MENFQAHYAHGYRGALALIGGASVLLIAAAWGCGSSSSNSGSGGGLPNSKANLTQVEHGRYLVTTIGCADCHASGVDDPSSATWLAGYIGPAGGSGTGAFNIGPFHTYAKNLTPDMNNGIGMHTDRQIYNALRYGLAPDSTPDVVITSTTPGVGNFPAAPVYLAPPMPWTSFRHLTDADIWSIVAYLKHGIKANANSVPDSQSPPGGWASSYTSAKVGPDQLAAYPATNEQFAP
ncbi:MAG: hypothetical protein KGJ62_06585 [Armatimonadetes bacterium]|nr:hypothetical protein [Armatimonadota bacterium]MDE2208076.1 hypothetical protein [Armatimonadota bacterium]